MRRDQLEALEVLNRKAALRESDPETDTRIAQYETAFRMQTSVPELTDLSSETAATLADYGPQASQPGTFAANCLMARRMAERGIRFIQLYHRGWDQHYNLPSDLRLQCGDVDRPCAALIRDLKQRGLLDDTLVIWGGEFGRTVTRYRNGNDDPGRDHNNRAFSMWLAGGGVKGGTVYGATDEFGATAVTDKVHVHDLHATVLRLLGFDHEKLTYRYNGRDFRLTDNYGEVVTGVLA